jgi:hypothetical protein
MPERAAIKPLLLDIGNFKACICHNNNMLDGKDIIMMHVKIGCTRNPNHYEHGGGPDTGTYQHTKTKK